MDYDDNDFQGQNLHLAGEGSAKFPPVLRPYALSKFDFDESLQASVRFDSLVETEIFLGIESNEDNQWIDAYSRGGSGIEFNPTATASCSVSRHENVWSEATSSESVEMLLKSVGQEEYIPGQTSIQQLDAFDELACLAKQMDSNPKPDNKHEFKDNVADLQPLDVTHTSCSALKEDIGMEQSQAGVSQGHEGELSIDESSGTLEPNDVCQNIDMPVSEGNLTPFTDDKSNSTNQREVETVADDSHPGKNQDDSSAFVVQTNITESCMRIMGDEKQGPVQTLTSNEDLEYSVVNKEAVVDTRTADGNAVGGNAHHPDKSLCSFPTKETLEGTSVVEGLETRLSSLEDSLRMGSVAVSELQKAKRSSEDKCSFDVPRDSGNEDVNLLRDVVMDDQSVLNACESPKVSIKDDSVYEKHVVEVNNSDGGTCPNLQQNVDAVEKITFSGSTITKENELLITGDPMDAEILSKKSETPLVTTEENNFSIVGEGNSDSRVGSFSSFGVVASLTKSSVLGESTQICVNKEPDRQSDHEDFDQEASVNDKENKRIPSDSSQMHNDVAQSHVGTGAISSSLSTDSMKTELTTSTVSIDIITANNSAPQVTSEPPSVVVSPHGATVHNDFLPITHVKSPSGEKEEFAVKIAEEAGISALVGSSEQETASDPVKGAEKHHPSDTSRELLCDTSDYLDDVGPSSAVKIVESQGTIGDKVIQECTKEIGIPPVMCESSEKQDGDLPVSLTKDDKETLHENDDKSSPKKSGDILLGNKGPAASAPSPVSCVELHETGSFLANSTFNPSSTLGSHSQIEKDENEAKASANQTPPVSDFKSSGANNTLSAAQDLKGNDASKDKRSSTPELNPVVDLPQKDITDVNAEDVGKMQSVPAPAINNASTAVEGSPSTSGLCHSKIKTVENVSLGISPISGGEVAHSASKATPERKTKRSYNKRAVKESSRRGSRVKDTTPAGQSERGGKSTKVSLSPPPGFQLMQSNEVKQYGLVDSNSTKSLTLVNTSTSSLPDLNTSASTPVLFHQPFTDLQQVQLRAQIFVYGALIQGIVPDEAYMISAFGGPDGGRSLWENGWHACMEKQRGKKSHPVNPETPLQSRSVARTSDLAVKQSPVQGKGISSLLGQASSKASPTTANPLIPLSSPLWSLPTFTSDSLQSNGPARGSSVDYPQPLAALHPFQSPPVKSFLGHNTSWLSQASLRGPWVSSPTPSPSTHLSATPVFDTIKLGSGKGSSLPPSSSIKNVTPGPPASSAGLQSDFVGTASLLDVNNVTVSPAQHSSGPKSKKRKKALVSEDLGQKALQSLNPVVSNHTSTFAVLTPLGNVPVTAVEKSIVSVSPLDDQPKNDQNVEKRILSDESLMKVKEAKVHAEEASALSAAAVNHSLELWNQLDKHKNSRLMPDVEAKLASAAVAVAAAAAVAKAAAAAANVASNAAFQAKLMADEALISSGYEKSCQSNIFSLSEGTVNFGNATPASILKGANGNNSPGSLIVAAKEAVKRRVEAASAATQRAENMDAIVKAAELAAEAVSQAGKIVTMNDPMPLSDLIDAGPDGYWKNRVSSQEAGLLNDMTKGPVNIENDRDIPETSHVHNKDRDIPGGDSVSIKINENKSRGPKGRKVCDLVKPVDMVPGSEPEIRAPSFSVSNGSENLEENNFKEGSLVEVFKDEEGYKAAWFGANILSLKNDKAYVCYTSLVSVEGAGPLKEWVSLEHEGDKPPRIRTARPLISLQHEGTRKRRRAAMGDYAWSVGDRVDAWVQESWQEGVITEKNKKDETTLTVHFPGSGETSVVRAWHVHPSLIWKDGKWIESTKVEANDRSAHEGDTPNEKRPKLGSNAVEVKGKIKMSKSTEAVESANPDEMRLLNLTENEKVFNIGKSSKNESKQDPHRMARTGLQKEGSRVIFGVPKPGKKRKFMDVSQHYVEHGKSNTNDGNDSVKIANFLMPQGSGSSRVWKNSSRNDIKEKHEAVSKPKTKFGKPPSVLGRGIPPKDISVSNASSTTTNMTGHTERTEDSSKSASQSESLVERAPYTTTDGATEGPFLFSSRATSTDARPSKKVSTSRASKGKLAPAGDKLGKSEVEKAVNDNPSKPTSDVTAQRRSNRRIQPTSRLLEGLQSSLIISKIPSFSHNRNPSKGNK